VEKRLDKRQEIIQKFQQAIQEDVNQLMNEIKSVQNASNVIIMIIIKIYDLGGYCQVAL